MWCEKRHWSVTFLLIVATKHGRSAGKTQSLCFNMNGTVFRVLIASIDILDVGWYRFVSLHALSFQSLIDLFHWCLYSWFEASEGMLVYTHAQRRSFLKHLRLSRDISFSSCAIGLCAYNSIRTFWWWAKMLDPRCLTCSVVNRRIHHWWSCMQCAWCCHPKDFYLKDSSFAPSSEGTIPGYILCSRANLPEQQKETLFPCFMLQASIVEGLYHLQTHAT